MAPGSDSTPEGWGWFSGLRVLFVEVDVLVVACAIIGTDPCFSLWRHEECCRRGIEKAFLSFLCRYHTLDFHAADFSQV